MSRQLFFIVICIFPRWEVKPPNLYTHTMKLFAVLLFAACLLSGSKKNASYGNLSLRSRVLKKNASCGDPGDLKGASRKLLSSLTVLKDLACAVRAAKLCRDNPGFLVEFI